MAADPKREDIAVIGMSGRFPGASSVDELWSLLRAGKEGITTLADANPPAGSAPGGRYVPRRGIVADVDRFDAGFFRMSAAEADLLDPQHRLLLEVAWEALESACMADCDGQSLGVFVSTGISQYLLQNLLTNPSIIEQHGPLQLLLLNDKDTLATRISYFLNAQGPSMAVQTGCSSSLVALHVACRSLLDGECTAALVGGVSLALPQEVGYFYSEQMIHSRDGSCRAFDEQASGTVRGNGACAVVLRRLSDAQAAGDPIIAVIKGSAINNDGREKVGFTAPSPKGQAAVIAAAQERAGVSAETIALIEAHGTGTPLGDPVEARALKTAFRDVPPGTRCAIGAAKTNLGHLDAAAGLTGLIKVCLSLANEEIPAVVHFRKLNPRINFEGTPFFVNGERRPWPRSATPRRAGVSAFGIGGTNAHVIVEEAAPAAASPAASGPLLFAISAMTETAFAELCRRYREYLGTQPPEQLAGFAISTLVGRKAFDCRAAFVAASRNEAEDMLVKATPTRTTRRVRQLSISSNTPTQLPEPWAARLAALGVDATFVSTGEIHVELTASGARIVEPKGATADVHASEPRALELALLGALWTRGVSVDWRRLPLQAQRLHIPTYPFARERHWIEPAMRTAAPAQPSAPLGLGSIQAMILAEWRALTGKPELGADQNVFDAGATSLMVGQFIANCRTKLGLEVAAVDCYRDPTPSGLAATLTARSAPHGHGHDAQRPLADADSVAAEDAGESFTEL
jgi:acyl transferase domain-containing protein